MNTLHAAKQITIAFQITISKLPVKANKVDVPKLPVKIDVYINDAWLDSNH